MSSNRGGDADRLVDRWIHDPSTDLETVKGPYIQEAQRVANLFTKYPKVLIEGKIGSEKVIFTPEVHFEYPEVPETEAISEDENETGEVPAEPGDPAEPIKGSAYFFTGANEGAGETISCFMEVFQPDEKDPTQFRLTLDPNSGTLVETNGTYLAFKDKSLLDTAIAKVERQLAGQEFKRQKERKENIGAFVGLGAILSVMGGLSYAGWAIKNHYDMVGVHAREHRAAFDVSNYNLPGAPRPLLYLRPETLSSVSLDRFQKIPKFHKGESLEHPRIITIDAGVCDIFQTHLPKEARIEISDAPSILTTLLVARNQRGELVICSPNNGFPAGYAEEDVAVQIR